METSDLAYIQARIFQRSGECFFDSKTFITRFMRFPARTLDKSDCSLEEAETIGRRFLDTYSDEEGRTLTFERDALFWLGYLYRIWQARSRIPSRELCEIAAPDWIYDNVYRSLEVPPHDALREICRLKGLGR